MICIIEVPFTPSANQLIMTVLVLGTLFVLSTGLIKSLLNSHLRDLARKSESSETVIKENTVAIQQLTLSLDRIVTKIEKIDEDLEAIKDQLSNHHDALLVLKTQHDAMYPESCKTVIELSKKKNKKPIEK